VKWHIYEKKAIELYRASKETCLRKLFCPVED